MAELPAELVPGAPVPAVVPGRRLLAMRWGMIPVGRTNARGRPVLDTIVNARAETLFAKSAFVGLGRCIVPASGWYEWSGPPRRRRRWRISAPGCQVLALAAVWDRWRAPDGTEILSLATVTCAPNPEVAAVHDRMPAILKPGDLAGWLGETAADPASLLRTLPAGRLEVTPDQPAGGA